MKRTVILFSLCIAFLSVIHAQNIKASPLEGCWVWDGKGDEPNDTELVFVGNIMLTKLYNEMFYEGTIFSYTARTLDFMEGEYVWKYRISGNTLNITDDYDGSYKYVKVQNVKSPLEGIWKLTGGVDYLPGEDRFIVFTRDIMAFSNDVYEYQGYRVEFKGKKIFPSMEFLSEDGISAEKLSEMIMDYNLSGVILTISVEDESNTLIKVY